MSTGKKYNRRENGFKICHYCEENLPESEFRIGDSDRYRPYCYSCGRKKSKKHKDKDRERYRKRSKIIRSKPGYKAYTKNRHLKKKFGITLDQFNLMFLQQKGECAICGTHQKDLKQGLHVDHDHNTGKVRGLLCFKCNIGIGYLQHDCSILSKSIKYLNQS